MGDKTTILVGLGVAAALAGGIYLATRKKTIPTTQDPSLMLYYDMIQTTPDGMVKDLSGKGNHGVIMGNPNALGLFNGVDQYIDIPVSQSLLSPTFTWELWVSSNISRTQGVIGKSLPVTDFVRIYQTSANSYNFDAKIAGGVEVSNIGTPGFSLNTWNHVIATYDGINTRLYYNGEFVSMSSGPISDMNGSLYSDLHIGRIDTNRFSGSIGEVRIYNRAITDLEAGAHYQAQRSKYIP